MQLRKVSVPVAAVVVVAAAVGATESKERRDERTIRLGPTSRALNRSYTDPEIRGCTPLPLVN